MTQEPGGPEPSAASLALARSGSGEHPVIGVGGEIDVATSPLLRAELLAVLEQAPQTITLDVAQVSFIDSSGLGVLVGALKRLREHDSSASLRVVHPQDAVRKVFEITGLDELFELHS